jgi:hypothetical protein
MMVIKDITVFVAMGLVLYTLIVMTVKSNTKENFEEVDAVVMPETTTTTAVTETTPVVTTTSTEETGFAPATPSPNDPTPREILQTIKETVAGISDLNQLKQIYNTLRERNKDARGEKLMGLFKAGLIKPELIAAIISKRPTVATSIVEAFDNKTPADLDEVVSRLETIVKGLDVDKSEITDFTRQMLEQNRYIDMEGIMRQAVNNHMKYSQQPPQAYDQAYNSRIDDEWNTDGWTYVDPAKLVPFVTTRQDVFNEELCPVCPGPRGGFPLKLSNFERARHVMPSDNISVPYVKELNRPKF